MRRILLALAFVPGWLCLAAEPGLSTPFTEVSIGAYGVTAIPIVQDDSSTGGLFGIRGRLGFPYGAIEPSFSWLGHKNGKVDVDGTEIEFEAPEITSVAFNYLFRTGAVYYTAGIGWSSIEIPGGSGKSDEATYNFGSGVEIGIGAVSIDVSPRLFIINTAGSVSRKDLAIMAGVNYIIF